ncbi:MAG: DUF2207 domain-containing protein [Patescibacteria group bacterium]|nr:DUF2207 domain-containing protein [Patescibacteria group bacterium]
MKKILSSIFLLSCFLAFLLSCPPASARTPDQIYDDYVQDLTTDIIVNQDSSLDITENITWDFADIPDKHGIFRMLPTFYQKTNSEKVKIPIENISVTDLNNNPIPYSESTSSGILSLKIGDADKTVSGIVNYVIKYRYKNTIRFDNQNFDEFYWNLNGNFWEKEIDKFTANITFPSGITKNNVIEINKYDGSFGSKSNVLSDYKWIADNTIQVTSQKTLLPKEGITLSVTFPKNIISPPVLSFWEKYGDLILGLLLLALPILVFLICFTLWWKYGRDIGPGRAVAPEFEIPDDMNPMEMSVFLSNGSLKSSAISAAIVNLAVRGYLKIEAVPKQGIFSSADTKLIKLNKATEKLTDAEKNLLNYLLGSSNEVKISDLKNQFYKYIPKLKETCFNKLSDQKMFEKKGFGIQSTMLVIGALGIGGLFFAPAIISTPIFYVISIVSIAIIFIFAALMPKRSPEGEDLLWRIKGFKMYMMTAEKYRQKFIEKEGLFEKFLPYAMLFGITGLWISKMKEIYGEEYFNTYHPIWYTGYIGNFNIDNFSSQLSAVSSSMSSTMSSSPSSSGSGGGGFSGGGGGGGGGGSW